MNKMFPLSTICLLAATLIVGAQPASDGKEGSRPARERPAQRGDRFQGGFQPGGRGQLFPMMERVLTEEQKESLRTAMEGQREKTREIEEKLRVARRDLLKAGLTAEFNEESVRTKAQEIGKLDAELTVLRAKAFSQMKPTLSAEQIEQLKNPPLGGEGEGRPGNGRNPRGAPGERDQNDLPPKPK